MQSIGPSGQNSLAGRKRYPECENNTYHGDDSEQPPSIRLHTENENEKSNIQNQEPATTTSTHYNDNNDNNCTSCFSNTNNQAVKQNAELAAARRTSPPLTSGDTANLLQDLHIKTDLERLRRRSSVGSSDIDPKLLSSTSASSFTHRIPSVRSWLNSTAGSLSPGSAISSPQIAAMMDITPLPSPTMAPLESWRSIARTRSRASSTSSRTDSLAPVLSTPTTTFTSSHASPRKKPYFGLHQKFNNKDDKSMDDETAHARSRSISDYVPDLNATPKQRQHAVSTSIPVLEDNTSNQNIKREEFLGVSRGLVSPSTPQETTFDPAYSMGKMHEEEPDFKRSKMDIYNVKSISNGNLRSYEQIRLLGQGTFSKVYLAVRLVFDRKESVDYRQESTNMAGVRARSRRLVAVKVVEPGPAGGADASRIEVSLRREVELMRLVQHPSIVHLKAFGNDSTGRALLVMNYCPGGDLFELTSENPHVLTPALIRRIFAELVSAVRYLHQKYIVHRDIKLENVLMNIPVRVHNDVPDWQTLDRAVVTLTDLGLGREIPRPPESPLLETRCGSEDYAAPEILMGQAYDGRQTDAWALGVLLYALMECRLPFDALPGARGDPATLKARTPHRVARCEWAWVKYGDDDHEWDPQKGKDLEGARKIVEGLLKRNTRRTPLSEVREMLWVKDGIQIDGGLRWVEEEGL